MLVYYYLPYGYAGLNGKHIYGHMTGYPPRRISWREWKAHKEVLIQAPFTPSYLEKVTGKKCPVSLSFTIDTLKELDYRKLQKLATYFEISGLLPHTKLIYALRRAVRDL